MALKGYCCVAFKNNTPPTINASPNLTDSVDTSKCENSIAEAPMPFFSFLSQVLFHKTHDQGLHKCDALPGELPYKFAMSKMQHIQYGTDNVMQASKLFCN